MNGFAVYEIIEPPFLAQKQRRDCGVVPYEAVFGEVFAIFGTFFAKNGLEFSKIDRNRTVFVNFEKHRVVIALSR